MIRFEVVSDAHRKHPGAKIALPERATRHSVAYDLRSPARFEIQPMESAMIWTDVKAKFPEDVALVLNVRSSMGAQPVMMANTQGWVESDYYGNEGNDGNIGIRLFNLGKTAYVVEEGAKIAQGMFLRYVTADAGNTDAVRKGGFGSTDAGFCNK